MQTIKINFGKNFIERMDAKLAPLADFFLALSPSNTQTEWLFKLVKNGSIDALAFANYWPVR